MHRPRPRTVTMLTTVASRSMTWEKTSRLARPPPMAAIAPRIGMPAAIKPPNTNTMTSRLTGSAMPSPTRRSISTWWLMSLTSNGTPLVRAVAPGTAARAEEAARWIRSMAASWAALSSPGESAAVTRKPGPEDAVADRTSGAAAGDPGPPGTRKGDCTEATSGVADTCCCNVFTASATAVSPTPAPDTCTSTCAPVFAPADSRSWPVLDSPGTLGSPDDSRSKRDSPVTPPTAVANASTTATSQTPRTGRARRATTAPSRCIGTGVGARCLAVRRLTRDSLPAVTTGDSDDLFAASRSGGGGTAAGGERGASTLPPLAARMRPRSLDEVRGQGDVLRPGSPLRRLIDGSAGAAGPLSAIIWGPPGTGKTTLAHLVATAGGRRFEELSAVTAGVKDVRAVMDRAARERDLYDRQT